MLYINKQSNHPPAIIQQIPKSVSQRVLKLSSDHTTFTNAASTYNNALKNSGFNTNTECLPDEDPKLRASQRQKRSQNIIWFIPPFSQNVKTSVGRKFLALMGKHFPTTNYKKCSLGVELFEWLSSFYAYIYVNLLLCYFVIYIYIYIYIHTNKDKSLAVATLSFTCFGNRQATDRLFNYSCNKHH